MGCLHDWAAKTFLPVFEDREFGERAKKYYEVCKKHDVNEKECELFRSCAEDMGVARLDYSITRFYECSYEDASMIIGAVRF